MALDASQGQVKQLEAEVAELRAEVDKLKEKAHRLELAALRAQLKAQEPVKAVAAKKAPSKGASKR